jgi:hypothetical protein
MHPLAGFVELALLYLSKANVTTAAPPGVASAASTQQ